MMIFCGCFTFSWITFFTAAIPKQTRSKTHVLLCFLWFLKVTTPVLFFTKKKTYCKSSQSFCRVFVQLVFFVGQIIVLKVSNVEEGFRSSSMANRTLTWAIEILIGEKDELLYPPGNESIFDLGKKEHLLKLWTGRGYVSSQEGNTWLVK